MLTNKYLAILLSCFFCSVSQSQNLINKNKIGQTKAFDTGIVALKEVKVFSHKNQNERTLSIAKMSISNMDLPQTVGLVSSTVMADQQAVRVGDLLRNVSGVSLTQTRLGVNETYTARGYSIGVNGGAGSIFKNGLVSNIAGMPETASLESIEVMKGSTALLFGNVSGGLIVNMVTKKPKFVPGGELKMQLGSYQQYKPVIDIYGPINQRLAFRMVGSYENDQSYRDRVQTKRSFFNPSLLYQLGKNTSLLIQADYLQANLTPDFGIGALDSGRVLPTNIPISRFHNVDWAYNNVVQSSSSVSLNHAFNKEWNLSFAASLQHTDVDSYGAGLPNTVNKTGDWNRTLARAHSMEKDATAQINLNGKLKALGLTHQFLLGTDFTRITLHTDAFKISSNGVVVGIYDRINILDPSLYKRRNDIPDAAVTTITKAPSNRFGIYTQDLINLTNQIKILAGIRWSYQETIQTQIYSVPTQINTNGSLPTAFNQAFSPKLALIYQPTKNSSLFGSYSNSFTINTGTDIYAQLLKPSIIDQFEIGVKNNLWEDKLSVNLSVYRILNSNLAQQAEFRADGSLNSDATVKELKGQTTSDGMELDLNGHFENGFYFMAGWGYNHMRFTKTSGAKGSNLEGEQLVNNPRHTANITAFYTIPASKLKGLKLGFAAFYTGSRFGGYNNTVGQTQIGSRLLPLSGFATLDLTAGYQFKKIKLLCKLSNCTNTLNYLVHDNYSIAPIAPRQISATISYKF